MYAILRAIALGFVGYASPRFAVALGIPIDQWIVDAASWVTATKDVVTSEQALWGIGTILALIGLTAELWFPLFFKKASTKRKRGNKLLLPIFSTVVFGIAFIGSLIWLYRAYNAASTNRAPAPPQQDAVVQQPQLPTATAEAGILLECHISPAPPTNPPNGRMYTLSTFPIPQTSGGGGMIEQFIGTAGPTDWGKRKNGTLPIVYSCKLTSYRTEPVFQIQIPVRLTFIESIRDADGNSVRSGKVEIDRTWPIEIAKLEPGTNNSFEFFIRNDNDKWVQVRFPNTVAARTAAGANREIPLIQQTATGVTLHLVPYLAGKD